MKKFILATLVAAGFGLTGIAQNPATTNCATPDLLVSQRRRNNPFAAARAFNGVCHHVLFY